MEGLIHFIRAGGVVMYPLIALSLAAWIVIVERFLAFRTLGNTAPGLTDEALALIADGKPEEAVTLTLDRPGPVAESIRTVIEARDLPDERVARRVEEVGQPYFARLERFLPVLDTITTIAPLLGLLGTIIGMIGTFNAIAVQKSSQNQDNILAGVGEALYATATGILIAVICFVAYNYFASRIRTIISDTEQAATRMMNAIRD